ncbi:MAG: hypothetical protein HYU78_12755 [Rhodocyclales bacterium]|nr:hypothetical protein [Rhodocyclales bacterium]
MTEHVPFISVETGDDLIVSFGLGPHAETSLTLLRTPKFEHLLPTVERGVSVSDGSSGTEPQDFLVSVRWQANTVHIRSTAKNYTLDISSVDPAEINEAKAVLSQMNFDHRFEAVDV